MNNVTREVKHHVNAIYTQKNGSVMTYTTFISSVVNTPKEINYSNNLFTEFESKLFQNKEVYFYYLFIKYIEKTIDNIHHPEYMNEHKYNMEKI